MLREVDCNNSSNWFRLDNAAKIYPAANTKKWSGMFRLSVTLKQDIDASLLQRALEQSIVRFPSFNIRMRRGLFWYYFETNAKKKPIVMKDINNPCAPISWSQNNGFLLRVFYYGKRIAVDYFHSLTDATGAMIFLKTLTAQYLRLQGIDIPHTHGVLDVCDRSDIEEYEDAFARYADSKYRKRIKEERAYHMKGSRLPDHDISIITGIASLEQIKKLSKRHNATITEYLAAVLLYSFYKERQDNSIRKKPSYIAVSIPVNLRNYFESKTLRNFSLFINPGVDTILGEYTLDEMLLQIQYFMKANLNAKQLNAMMTQNVKAERNPFIRVAPLFVKNFVLSIAHKKVGYRPITTLISNYGRVQIPEEMEEHITRFEFLLGVAKIHTPFLAVVSCGDKLILNFTSRISETLIEKHFFTHLIKQGVNIKIESNRE